MLPSDKGKGPGQSVRGIGRTVEKRFQLGNHKPSYRDLLRASLGGDYGEATRGFDMLGDIAIIDAPSALAASVAKAVIASNPNVKTVLRKKGAVKGRYRTRAYAHVAGRRTFTATYRENGIVLNFDVRKSFFSNRLSFERGRIAGLSKGPEKVLVMFAGVGPFAICIAKRNPKAKVIAIELNKTACAEMRRNILLNKVQNVKPVCGDVRRQAAKYRASADRIVMPLPKDSRSFLDSVVTTAKRSCTVHYYAFVPADGGTRECIGDLSRFFSSKGRAFRVLNVRTVRPYSRDTIEIVVDFMIKKKA